MLTAYSRRQLAKQTALSTLDFEQIKKCRRPENRLGFAYQIGFVRLHNRFPSQQPFEIIDELLTYAAIQIIIDADLITEYAKHQHTVSDHQRKVRQYLQRKSFSKMAENKLQVFIFEEACRLEQSAALFAQAEQYLRSQHILQPADYRLGRIIGEQRKVAREQIFERITATLSIELRQTLDGLIVVGEEDSISSLQRIKANPKKPSADAILALTLKLALIEETGVIAIDLNWLNNNYQRSLFHYVRNCSADRLRNVTPTRRYASLVCFLRQSYRDTIDQTIDMYDKLLTRIQSQVMQAQLKELQQQRKIIKASLISFRQISEIVLDESIKNRYIRDRLFDLVSPDDLSQQLEAWWIGPPENTVMCLWVF